MNSQTILIIRHAEKPEPGVEAAGVDDKGRVDPKSLTPRGWLRAGAWLELIAPSLATAPQIPLPTAVFASGPAGPDELAGSRSKRPLQTVSALAGKLGITVEERFSKGQEQELASAISALDGVVLVCWQHEDIPLIARGLVPTPTGVPGLWPSDCFNVMFRFDRADAGASWSFTQVAPVMLDGDKPDAL